MSKLEIILFPMLGDRFKFSVVVQIRSGWFEDFVYSCGRKVGNIFGESEFLFVCMYLNSEGCVRFADRGCD